ncbi:hypothetical protein niasHT_038134 [Heterodera trifolii]|uniref:Large ribosomal subunit protein mL51 n=1 Tax=Heterodera trifolii TaxID=157864 RepID=A0ABD2HMY0_9BILA
MQVLSSNNSENEANSDQRKQNYNDRVVNDHDGDFEEQHTIIKFELGSENLNYRPFSKYLFEFLNNNNGENATTSEQFEHNDNNNDRDEDFGEEHAIIKFELGKTQKGGNCLWSEGFRYVLEKKNWWNCSVRNCPARVTIIDNSDNAMSGHLGQETTTISQSHKNNRVKPTRLLAEVRRSTAEETYVAMGSDNALSCMMRRQKKKILGNVDCVNFKPALGKNWSPVGHCFQFHIGMCTLMRLLLSPGPTMKGLCHHPALSDFIYEVSRSIDKQVDAARSARNFVHKRHKRYVLQDAVIMRILADATYNNDAEIHDLMTALGLQIREPWRESQARFGENDYIDLLGDGSLHPAQLQYHVPRWLRGFPGQHRAIEPVKLIHYRNLYKSKLEQNSPHKWHQLNKRIKYLLQYHNYDKSDELRAERSLGLWEEEPDYFYKDKSRRSYQDLV